VHGWRALLRAAVLLPLLACTPLAAQPAPQARDVEAAYLINFLRYTQWPPQAFADAQAPFVISVVGTEDDATAVRNVATAAGAIAARRIDVRRVAKPQDNIDKLRNSHLVFFGAEGADAIAQTLAALADRPVLTVSDQEGFVAHGGMIELVNAAGHIVFYANPSAIRSAGVVVSAKVLKLARSGEGPAS
jgi:hypothetical protein